MRSFVLIALFLTVSGLAIGSPGRGHAADTTVAMGDFFFCSASFQDAVCDTTITVGDTVTWPNQGAAVCLTRTFG